MTRVRSRSALAALGALALLVQLLLPLAHAALASSHAGAAPTPAGVAFAPADASDSAPRECALCDALAQSRRSFGAPSAPTDASTPVLLPACATPHIPALLRSAERSVRAARAPPVRSISA